MGSFLDFNWVTVTEMRGMNKLGFFADVCFRAGFGFGVKA